MTSIQKKALQAICAVGSADFYYSTDKGWSTADVDGVQVAHRTALALFQQGHLAIKHREALRYVSEPRRGGRWQRQVGYMNVTFVPSEE